MRKLVKKMIKINLKSESLLADDKFDIMINQLKPNQIIDVHMTLLDYYNINAPMRIGSETPWYAWAKYQADDNGVVSVNNCISLEGDYIGKIDMGLFFSCRPLKSKKNHLLEDVRDIPVYDSFYIKIEIFSKSKKIAEKIFKRYYQLPEISHETIISSKYQARLFYPSNAQNLPAIIVFSGSDGRIEKAQNIAQLLASRGFVTLAVAYFGLRGISRYLDRIPLEIVKENLDYLANLDIVDENRIGLYGRSKGAELSLVAASLFSQFRCLVVNSPSCAILEGLKGRINSKHSSWTYQNKELPYTKFSIIEFFKEKFLGQKFSDYELSSLIKAKEIGANVLMIGEKSDEIWNTEFSIKLLEKQLQKRKNGLVKSILLNNGGHMLTIAYQPNQRYTNILKENLLLDSVISWKATIDFFKNYL